MPVRHALVSGVPNVGGGIVGGEDWDADHVGASSSIGSTWANYFDDCFFIAATQLYHGGISSATSGTSALVSQASSTAVNHPGVLQMSCGTTATGRAMLIGQAGVVFGGGQMISRTWAQIRLLSDGTNTFTVRTGWNNSNAGDGVDGIFFRYTHSVNSGKWQAVTRSNSSETAEDTGVTADASTTVGTNMHRFEIVVNAAGTNVDFYIDGTLTNDITTTIPTGSARNTNPCPGQIVGSAGSSSFRQLYLDAYSYEYEFTTPR